MNRRQFLGQSALAFAACSTNSPSKGDKKTSSTDTGTGSTADTGTATDTGSTLEVLPSRMPHETEPHGGCIMQFPPPTNYCPPGSSTCGFIEAARQEWMATATAVAQFEPVLMYADPADAPMLRSRLPNEVTVLEVPLSDGWSRDSAPLFLVNANGEVRAAGFGFNGWGESVEFANDALVKPRMAADLGVPLDVVDMILEGGAIWIEGNTLVTTEMCLLHPSRNPTLDKMAQEAILRRVFGVERFIWLAKGWEPDPLTNGHIDGFCAPANPGTFLINQLGPKSQDPNAQMLLDNRAALVAAGFEVIDLPATSFTAFHVNFYLPNGAVVVPIEGSRNDDIPMGILREAFPDRQVVGVKANTLGSAGGGIHCITQQVPLGVTWPS